MAYGSVATDQIVTSVANTSLGAGNASIMKNRIINGTQIISQRNGISSVTPAAGAYMTDRWVYNASQASKVTAQQGLSGGPAGFPSNLGLTVASAVSSLGATDNFYFQQKIEGFNIADLGWGTASAKPVTLSFWVQSNLTGTFGGAIRNGAENRSYPFTYTISSANTWTQATVTIAGDTTGTWTTDNSTGLSVAFSLGMGSTYSGTAGAWAATNYASATGATNVMATLSNTFYITGVQLEVGSSATGYEYRSYGTELALCQRYYEKSYNDGTAPGTATIQGAKYSSGSSGGLTTSFLSDFVSYKVSKRARGNTVTIWDPSGNSGKCQRENYGVSSTANSTVLAAGSVNDACGFDTYSPGTANAMVISYQWTCSSEL